MDKGKRLERIAHKIEKCALCRQWGSGKPVPGEGNPEAKVVFIGEAPGRIESVTGKPFSGRSGKFFRQALRDAGFDEEGVFISSPVKYLPFRGKPTVDNITHGATHMREQLSVIVPEILVLMGSTACLAMLGGKVQMKKERGTVLRQGGRTYLITFHPAYAMRFPSGKAGFLRDLKRLKTLVEDAVISRE